MRAGLILCHIGLFGVLLAAGAGNAAAQQGSWIELGVGSASRISTSAYIPGNTGKGTVCSIRLKLDGAGVELNGLTVHFGNGQTMRFVVDDKVGPDSTSKTSSLPGPPRTVRGLDIVYSLQDKSLPPPAIHLWGYSMPNVDGCPR